MAVQYKDYYEILGYPETPSAMKSSAPTANLRANSIRI